MQIILEKEEALGFIHLALCSGGLEMLLGSGLELTVSDEDYLQAKKELVDTGDNPCFEDVWIQILRSGKSLEFYDHEGDETGSFDLSKAIQELSKERVISIIGKHLKIRNRKCSLGVRERYLHSYVMSIATDARKADVISPKSL